VLTNVELADFLRALVVLLLSAHSLGYVFQRLRLPRVIGEIGGGFLLGPSVLGLVAPGAAEFLVSTGQTQVKLLSAIYWIGLTLLMFIAGFRVQSEAARIDRKVVATLVVSDTVVPVAAGFLAATHLGLGAYAGPAGTNTTIGMIFAIATAVTSIPVISRIFLDLKIIDTPFARNVLAAATLQDIFLWSVLAVATGLAARQETSALAFATASGKALLFCVGGLVFGPVMLRLAARNKVGSIIKSARLGYMMAWCMLVAAIAAIADINVIFGAFIAGIAFGGLKPEAMREEKQQISAFALGFFVPLYFAIVGYRIDIPSAFDFELVAGFLLASSAVGLACVALGMRVIGATPLVGLNYAIAMNTRGGPGIVLASVAFDFGIVDERVFLALVITAIATSLATGVWFRYLLDRNVAQRGF
jgi:Kef-type K+ transport system membrane component KefB